MLGWIIGLLAVGTVGVASQQDNRETVAAQKFVVVDPETGQRHAVLEMGGQGPFLRLFTDGSAVVELGVNADGPTLVFVNQ